MYKDWFGPPVYYSPCLSLALVKRTELCLTDGHLFIQQTFTDTLNPCLKALAGRED